MTALDHPFNQRTTIGLGAALILSVIASWFGIGHLDRARHRLASVEAMAQAGALPTMPLLPDGMGFAGRHRRSAEAAFEHRLVHAVARHRLLVERLEMRPVQKDRPAMLAADITLSGSEADILGFARIIESSRPTIRFEDWRVSRTAADETTVRIEAGAIGLWEATA